MSDWTHAELCNLAAKWLTRRPRNCRIAVSELPALLQEHPDAVGWNSWGSTMLVEVKVSRSDFRADRRKPYRNGDMSPMGDLRWYMAPAGLLPAEEMPTGWGLLEVYGRGKVCETRKAEQQARDADGRFYDLKAATIAMARLARGEKPDPVTMRFPSVREAIARRAAKSRPDHPATPEQDGVRVGTWNHTCPGYGDRCLYVSDNPCPHCGATRPEEGESHE